MDEYKNKEINENTDQVKSTEEENLDQVEETGFEDQAELKDNERSKIIAREVFSWVKIIIIALLIALIVTTSLSSTPMFLVVLWKTLLSLAIE